MSRNNQDKINMYVDWLNNFLTVSAFADYYHIGDEEAENIINEGRILFNMKEEL